MVFGAAIKFANLFTKFGPLIKLATYHADALTETSLKIGRVRHHLKTPGHDNCLYRAVERWCLIIGTAHVSHNIFSRETNKKIHHLVVLNID